MKKKTFKALCCVLSLSLLIGVFTGCSQSISNTDKQSQVTKLSKTVKSKDNVCQINIPDSWSEDKTLNSEAVLQVANKSEEKYLIVIEENKSDFSNSANLDDYYSIVSKHLTSSITNANAGTAKDITINGKKAKQFEISGEVQKIKASYIITLVETDKHLYQVISWSLTSKFDQNKKDLNDVINTFKEL
ncbi:MAG: hypothetical protein Q8936_18020 [Bacillota bacterium]|nr:hypothetical protein [Bacillota bacterium]